MADAGGSGAGPSAAAAERLASADAALDAGHAAMKVRGSAASLRVMSRRHRERREKRAAEGARWGGA